MLKEKRRGLLNQIDDIVFACRMCQGTGIYGEGRCPVCAMGREVRDLVYTASNLPIRVDWGVGPVRGFPDGRIEPLALGDTLSRTQRHILLELLKYAPNPAPDATMLDYDWDTITPHLIRVHVSRLRDRLDPYPVEIIRQPNFGYRLVEAPDA